MKSKNIAFHGFFISNRIYGVDQEEFDGIEKKCYYIGSLSNTRINIKAGGSIRLFSARSRCYAGDEVWDYRKLGGYPIVLPDAYADTNMRVTAKQRSAAGSVNRFSVNS